MNPILNPTLNPLLNPNNKPNIEPNIQHNIQPNIEPKIALVPLPLLNLFPFGLKFEADMNASLSFRIHSDICKYRNLETPLYSLQANCHRQLT